MMLRFILETVKRDVGHVSKGLWTLDAECPQLEAALRRSGAGGGPDGEDFIYSQLHGVEVLKTDDEAAR
jgi:hypothetical protein